MKRKMSVVRMALAMLMALVVTSGLFAETKLTYLTAINDALKANNDAVIAAFTAKTGINVEVVTAPGGAEGENYFKTLMAANEMTDIVQSNSGSSFFSVINPAKNMLDLSKEPYMNRLIDSFKSCASVGSAVYGIPIQPVAAGGIVYNKAVYAQLGLKVPKTWKDFLSNCEKIKSAGKVAVIAPYKDDWTAQLIMLADYYNLQAAVPKFAVDFTANKLKYATTPAAVRGFEKLQEVYVKGYLNKEPLSTTYDMAQAMLASGEGVHFPMGTWVIGALATSFPDKINDIGFFALPGDSADKNGATLWMPGLLAISKTSKNIDAAKKLLAFWISDEGFAAYNSVSAPSGTFAIKGVKMPDTLYPAIKDVVAYVDANKTAPALEFVSPVKGPNLPQICVEVGIKGTTPLQAAQKYDQDNAKQAKQLKLAGW